MKRIQAASSPFALARRALLKRLAALGLLGPAGLAGLIQEALAKGDMPKVSSIYFLEGTVTVNGSEAKVGTPVKAGDRIETGKKDSRAVVYFEGDAFLLREHTNIELKGKSTGLDLVNVVGGKLLSVFGKRRAERTLTVRVQSATIGIRGTGMYLEAGDKRTYFCLCYGEAAIEGAGMAEPRVVNTKHHEMPLFLDDSGGSMKVEKGTVINHTDDELIMLEALCGREPPFKDIPFSNRY